MSIIEKAISKLNQTKPNQTKPKRAKLNRTKQSDNIAVQEQKIRLDPEITPDTFFSKLQFKFSAEKLSIASIVSPNEQAPFVAGEMRRIKQPLLNYALNNSPDSANNNNVIMVTSSLPGEGKSFLAMNLALSIALEKKYNVLLVDADVIMPKITMMFELEERSGLTDKLAEPDLDIADLLLTTDVPGLSILSVGKNTESADQLFSGDSLNNLIRELAVRYTDGLIIFDTPSLLTAPESAVLSELMGQIVMVVEANKTPRSAVSRSVGLLDKSKSIGIVLNKTSIGSGY